MIRRMKCDRMNELSDHKPKKAVMVNGSGGLNGKYCSTRKRRKNIRRVRELSGMKGWRERLGRTAECSGRNWWN